MIRMFSYQGYFSATPPSHILKSWERKQLQIVLSQEILNEYMLVAEDICLKYPMVDISPIIYLITIYAQFIDTKDIKISVCEDPDDDKFIECAIAGKCNIVVSGDRHLLKLAGYKGIKILEPRDFLEQYL